MVIISRSPEDRHEQIVTLCLPIRRGGGLLLAKLLSSYIAPEIYKFFQKSIYIPTVLATAPVLLDNIGNNYENGNETI